jgi:hypothetical protein
MTFLLMWQDSVIEYPKKWYEYNSMNIFVLVILLYNIVRKIRLLTSICIYRYSYVFLYSGRSIVISCAISFRVDLTTHFVCLDHKNKILWILGNCTSKIQDGRQTRMFHNLVNFHFKLYIIFLWSENTKICH